MAVSPPPLPPPFAAHASVLDFWAIYSDAPNALYKDFADEAFARLAARKAAVDRLESRADWARHQQEARRQIVEVVGPFPERTPHGGPCSVTANEIDGLRRMKVAMGLWTPRRASLHVSISHRVSGRHGGRPSTNGSSILESKTNSWRAVLRGRR